MQSDWSAYVEKVRRRAQHYTERGRKAYVYFIRADRTGPIKIGFSCAPGTRLKALRSAGACPYSMDIIAILTGNAATEKLLHDRFRRYRLAGEWFHPARSLMGVVAYIAKTMNEEEIRAASWNAAAEAWHREFIEASEYTGLLSFGDKPRRERTLWSPAPPDSVMRSLAALVDSSYHDDSYAEMAVYAVALHALQSLSTRSSALTVLQFLRAKVEHEDFESYVRTHNKDELFTPHQEPELSPLEETKPDVPTQEVP